MESHWASMSTKKHLHRPTNSNLKNTVALQRKNNRFSRLNINQNEAVELMEFWQALLKLRRCMLDGALTLWKLRNNPAKKFKKMAANYYTTISHSPITTKDYNLWILMSEKTTLLPKNHKSLQRKAKFIRIHSLCNLGLLEPKQPSKFLINR